MPRCDCVVLDLVERAYINIGQNLINYAIAENANRNANLRNKDGKPRTAILKTKVRVNLKEIIAWLSCI